MFVDSADSFTYFFERKVGNSFLASLSEIAGIFCAVASMLFLLVHIRLIHFLTNLSRLGAGRGLQARECRVGSIDGGGGGGGGGGRVWDDAAAVDGSAAGTTGKSA